jgi:hypothetical protein
MRAECQRFRGGCVAAAIVCAMTASANAQTVLIDFGSDTSFRGVSVPNPDPNGHYWNSLQPGLYYTDLVDMANVATTIDLGFSTPVGTDSYNGPAGPTSDPPMPEEILMTDIDTVALGDLGVIEAAFDYAAGADATCRFEIQGLDPAKTYTLTFFGSHKFNSDFTTIYRVYTDNTYTTVVDEASLDVYLDGFPWLHNRDTVATISNLAPQTFNILYVEFIGSEGGNGYLNDMKIEGVSAGCPNAGCDSGGIDVDFDNDCSIGLSDLAYFLGNFGVADCPPDMDIDGDGDCDGDLSGLALLLSRFGNNCN